MPDIDDFLARLASGDPVPGGGSVAGFEVAMGAALIAMVCELTVGRAKFAAVEPRIAQIRDQAVTLKARARRLVDEDAEAFSEVAAAMKLPRATDDQKMARREALQLALKGAVSPPLETMRCAAYAMRLAVDLTPIGNPSAISDVGSAALALDAGYHAAKLNVETNLTLIRDQKFVRSTRKQLPLDMEVDQGKAQTVRLVTDSIRGAA